MKKSTFVLIVMISIMAITFFTSCERKSGKLPASKPETEVIVIIKDTYPEPILIDTGLTMYKTKCLVEKDSTVVFILTHNQFDNGDRVVVKITEILKN